MKDPSASNQRLVPSPATFLNLTTVPIPPPFPPSSRTSSLVSISVSVVPPLVAALYPVMCLPVSRNIGSREKVSDSGVLRAVFCTESSVAPFSQCARTSINRRSKKAVGRLLCWYLLFDAQRLSLLLDVLGYLVNAIGDNVDPCVNRHPWTRRFP